MLSFLSFRVRKSLCAGPGASGHKNRLSECLDFPFLTVNLLRKRHLNKTFFFLCVFSKNTCNGGAKLLWREDFSAPSSLFPKQAQVKQSFCP